MITEYVLSALGIGTFLAVFESATIRFKISSAHSRKIVHVASSFFVILFSIIFDWDLFILLGAFFALLLYLMRIIHPLVSLKHRSGESYGEIVFPLGVMAAAFLSQTLQDFIVCMLILGVSDTLAFYIGRAAKTKKLLYQKTIAGSGSFLISAFLISLLFLPPIAACSIALTTTASELTSPKGIDNFTIATVAAMTLLLF